MRYLLHFSGTKWQLCDIRIFQYGSPAAACSWLQQNKQESLANAKVARDSLARRKRILTW